MSRPLELRVLAERFAIARLEPKTSVPDWIGGEVTCITRTPSELSIVCAEDQVPDSVRSDRPWSCLEVAGPLDFSEIGVLDSLTTPLREAGISVFVFSTFDTDYLLVRAEKLALARTRLEDAGHRIIAGG
jgi:hypothetical protein